MRSNTHFTQQAITTTISNLAVLGLLGLGAACSDEAPPAAPVPEPAPAQTPSDTTSPDMPQPPGAPPVAAPAGTDTPTGEGNPEPGAPPAPRLQREPQRPVLLHVQRRAAAGLPG